MVCPSDVGQMQHPPCYTLMQLGLRSIYTLNPKYLMKALQAMASIEEGSLGTGIGLDHWVGRLASGPGPLCPRSRASDK